MLSRTLIAAVTMLLTFTSIADAVDLLYVSLNNEIATYDTSSNVGSTIAATKAVFANTHLNEPYGMAFDNSGNLYVANRGGNSISKFDTSGLYVSNITSNLNVPTGIAFDSSGNLYVANQDGNSISKFNASGGFVSNITTNLNYPLGIAFDSSGNLYAANHFVSTISKFDGSGAYINSISTHLDGPWGIAFDSLGNLYASNNGSNANINEISKYDSAGSYLGSITSNLTSPLGITFDSSGNLYAANYRANTISKFNSSGNFLTSWSVGTGVYGAAPFLAFKPVSVPEPSTYILVTIAASALAFVAHRSKR